MALKGAINTDYLSDGAHTFGELYYHRAVLFALLLNKYISGTYWSKLHRDGTMFEGIFVVSIKTPAGHYSYHFPLDYWDLFEETPTKFLLLRMTSINQRILVDYLVSNKY